jgi:ABC-type branched-subunit amino acid transport system substrate-binding protein
LSFLLVFLLSACLPPPLPSVIKLGLVAPFEGRYRSIGYDAIYAARLAVREINAAGGVDGWQIELVAYDDRGNPDLARTAARNLTVDPDVVAVIGHYRQESTAAAQAAYADAGLPLIALNAWMVDSPLTWSLTASPARVAQEMLAAVPPASDVTVWGEGVQASALRSLAETLHHRYVVAVPEDCGAISAHPALQIFGALPPQRAGDYLAEWRTRGWTGTLVGGPELAAADFAEIAGEAALGTCFATPYPFPDDLQETASWRVAYLSVGPHVPEPGPYALPTYEAIYLLAEALAADVAAHGRPTRAGMAAALPDVTRDGLLGRIRWDAEGGWDAAPLYRYCWLQGEAGPVQCLALD